MHLLKLQAGRYPPFIFGTWSFCSYCGESPNCKDHCIPFSFLSLADRNIKRSIGKTVGPQALSCGKCNSMLGSKYFDTFLERCEYLSKRYFKSALKISATWEDSELKKLDHNLKSLIEQKQIKKQWLYEKSNWYLSDAFFYNLENLLYEPTLQKDSPRFFEYYHKFFSGTLDRVKSSVDLREEIKRSEKKYQ